MKIAGIIAEYNPFHNGHKYHLDQVRKITGADAVVAVISGPVMQRGEPALWDKWSRARMAVDNGVDLVLELPYAFAVNSAEEFARGGVSILNSLGCVTDLVFGCESDPEAVISMARRSAECEAEFQEFIRNGLEEGLSYPQARGKAMMRFLGEEAGDADQQGSLDLPNDILAVEYVRQLVLQGADMVPHGVTRLGSYHDDAVQKTFSSATAVRKAIREERWEDVERAVPEETLNVLHERQYEKGIDSGRLDSMILSCLLMLGPEGIRKIYGCSEGLEYRIWNALSKASSVEELLELTASGRYPTARIRRLLM
ncbi:MAG: nucleotidyltransferase family protein, partial [Firmicutes bacterium]|nr:nucleotidyltransferase family protein [Bacillota bacterium]